MTEEQLIYLEEQKKALKEAVKEEYADRTEEEIDFLVETYLEDLRG